MKDFAEKAKGKGSKKDLSWIRTWSEKATATDSVSQKTVEDYFTRPQILQMNGISLRDVGEERALAIADKLIAKNREEHGLKACSLKLAICNLLRPCKFRVATCNTQLAGGRQTFLDRTSCETKFFTFKIQSLRIQIQIYFIF